MFLGFQVSLAAERGCLEDGAWCGGQGQEVEEGVEGGQGLQVHGQPAQHPGQEGQWQLGEGGRDTRGRSAVGASKAQMG